MVTIRKVAIRALWAMFFSMAPPLLAQDVPSNYRPFYGGGIASDVELDQALGDLNFSVTECASVGLGSSRISVRGTSSKSAYSDQRIIDAFLLRAAKYAWENCQIHFSFAGGVSQMPDTHHDIERAELVLPDGNVAIQASNLFGDEAFNVGRSYKWGAVHDAGEQRRREVAWAAAQQEQARQQAEARARADAESARFWSNLWDWIRILAAGAVVLWLLSKWETILRWYYMSTPHPATTMVESAIQRGENIDGKALADALRVTPGNRVEQRVRVEQANRLTEMSRQHAERLRQEAEAIRAKAEKETEHIRANEALAKAAIEHEKAKARVEALRRGTR